MRLLGNHSVIYYHRAILTSVLCVNRERKALDNLMIDKRTGAYVGIDPTAPSLHIGHMIPLMALFWMHIHGFHTISLVCEASLPKVMLRMLMLAM
jgi:tyrosyl-tRNA synthetase